MTNDQNHAARKAFNPNRTTLGMRATLNSDGSETISLYRLADLGIVSAPFVIVRETPVAEVSRLFTASIRSIL